MPKRDDIKSILVIGAGPIVIGQACEFDYSGTQAIKTLREEGYRVILVNSNPATIMTDPEMADATYIEPISAEMVEKVIAAERPDALLPTMGGQTALNCAKELAESGVLEKYGVELIGAKLDAIDKAENRQRFNQAMEVIDLETPRHAVVHSVEEAQQHLEHIGLPAVIRPSFTMGGTGGGIAYNKEEYDAIVASGLDASPTTEVLIDESVLGWKEYEMEVVRDSADNCIIICSIENIDPMGVHTGDSITVAPALTLTDKEYQIMRNASLAVLREIGVETGGSNVQFAINPEDGRMVVIEMNPRVSRSSALASKATGFPIAKVAAKLAVGYHLDEITNDITQATPAAFEPTIDYVVTKIPRFAFEKFAGASPILNTAMHSVGEAMAIGRNFPESLQKAYRSLETGLHGMDEVKLDADIDAEPLDAFREAIAKPTPERLLQVGQALRLGMSVEEAHSITKIDPWFLRQMLRITDAEKQVKQDGFPLNATKLIELKKLGFSDEQLAGLAGKITPEVTALRHKLGVHPVYKRIDTCAAEFEALTPYMYSTYEGDGVTPAENEADVSDKNKVVILGGGPNRIGQGIEFDYCCVHAAYALREVGIETIMINCNPETVSTDYDTSDRLYFEPLTEEDVIEVIKGEQKKGYLQGVIVQFGGQTPLKLAGALEREGIPIIGTSQDSIDLAEDRERFQKLLFSIGLRQPPNQICHNHEEALEQAAVLGYPLVVRPSYVLGGRAMQIIHTPEALKEYVISIAGMFGEGPILLDTYLNNAIELDVDALCDGKSVYIAGILEHIEEAGIHSGDSTCSLPPHSLSDEILQEVREQTFALAKALNVIGLMNIQFAIQDGEIYILEVNPRASRTVPFIAKATGVPVAKIASRLMVGERLSDFGLDTSDDVLKNLKHSAVKEAVFPFARFPGVDVILGPEMRSTGETMGLDMTFAEARAKAHLAANLPLPLEGTVFVSVRESDKQAIAPAVEKLMVLGFDVVATDGTAKFLQEYGLTQVQQVNKVLQGRPHIVDRMINDEINLVLNTTEGAQSIKDSFSIRRTALMRKIPYSTTVSGSFALVEAIEAAQQKGGLKVKPLQAYF
ncbi:MAG: carbamoyl-phosphate synthase large subunit [Rickettsiales bacterium]|nr:carbamoyl-phosphate synthase large subunit [Rickettsiales bacterium]